MCVCMYVCVCARVYVYIHVYIGFPGGSDGKKPACNARNLGLIARSARSLGEGNGYPLQYSCLGELHGKRSLAGYGSQMDSSK